MAERKRGRGNGGEGVKLEFNGEIMAREVGLLIKPSTPQSQQAAPAPPPGRSPPGVSLAVELVSKRRLLECLWGKILGFRQHCDCGACFLAPLQGELAAAVLLAL